MSDLQQIGRRRCQHENQECLGFDNQMTGLLDS